MHVDFTFIGRAGVDKRLEDGLVRVLKLDVFAHEGDVHHGFRGLESAEEASPVRKIRLGEVLDAQVTYHELVEVLLVHIQRNLIDAPGIYGLYDVTGLDIAEEGHFPAQVRSEMVLGAADYDVGLHA